MHLHSQLYCHTKWGANQGWNSSCFETPVTDLSVSTKQSTHGLGKPGHIKLIELTPSQ